MPESPTKLNVSLRHRYDECLTYQVAIHWTSRYKYGTVQSVLEEVVLHDLHLFIAL